MIDDPRDQEPPVPLVEPAVPAPLYGPPPRYWEEQEERERAAQERETRAREGHEKPSLLARLRAWLRGGET